MLQATFVPPLVDLSHERILSKIRDSNLSANRHLIQDELADPYKVSRQPVQQASIPLREQGFVMDGPQRGGAGLDVKSA